MSCIRVFFLVFFSSFLSNISCFFPVLNHISILRILRSDYLFCQLVCLRSCALGSHRVCVCVCV